MAGRQDGRPARRLVRDPGRDPGELGRAGRRGLRLACLRRFVPARPAVGRRRYRPGRFARADRGRIGGCLADPRPGRPGPHRGRPGVAAGPGHPAVGRVLAAVDSRRRRSRSRRRPRAGNRRAVRSPGIGGAGWTAGQRRPGAALPAGRRRAPGPGRREIPGRGSSANPAPGRGRYAGASTAATAMPCPGYRKLPEPARPRACGSGRAGGCGRTALAACTELLLCCPDGQRMPSSPVPSPDVPNGRWWPSGGKI